MNQFNLSLYAVLVLLVLGLWTCNSCQKAKIAQLENKEAMQPVEGSAIHFDTVKVAVHDTIVKSATQLKPVSIRIISHDTVTNEQVIYKDTSLSQYGAIIISDTVQDNRLQGRSVITNFSVPVVTKIVELPKRNQVYLGINFQGNPNVLLNAFGPSLMLKTKTDHVLEIGALYDRSGNVQYQAGLKFLIHLKK